MGVGSELDKHGGSMAGRLLGEGGGKCLNVKQGGF
jgi:hypothetical protein